MATQDPGSTPGGNQPGGTPSLQGTWYALGGRVVTFTENNLVYQLNGNTRFSGAISITDYTINFDGDTSIAYAVFMVTETTLTLDVGGLVKNQSIAGTYTRNIPSSTGGILTITGIPSRYNGMYAGFSGFVGAASVVYNLKLHGGEYFDDAGGIVIYSRIANGSVSLPMWAYAAGYPRYTDDSKAGGTLTIYNCETVFDVLLGGASSGHYNATQATRTWSPRDLYYGYENDDYAIIFSKGNATISWDSAFPSRNYDR